MTYTYDTYWKRSKRGNLWARFLGLEGNQVVTLTVFPTERGYKWGAYGKRMEWARRHYSTEDEARRAGMDHLRSKGVDVPEDDEWVRYVLKRARSRA